MSHNVTFFLFFYDQDIWSLRIKVMNDGLHFRDRHVSDFFWSMTGIPDSFFICCFTSDNNISFKYVTAYKDVKAARKRRLTYHLIRPPQNAGAL